MSDKLCTVGVVGAGTMGSGIAQAAAQAGHPVFVLDKREETLGSLRGRLQEIFAGLTAKGKITEADAAAVMSRVSTTSALEKFGVCDVVIEAVVEDLTMKKQLFSSLERYVRPSCTLATNTSSLSITAVAAACARPERVIGVHFFNPAPVMKLVEVIPGFQTSEESVSRVEAMLKLWGKTTVRVADTPGFIVNRIARPFYGEALRIHEEQIADAPTIDWAMRELGGFRMGPFELMDLIGIDVNLAVTETVFRSFYYDPRYRPSAFQQQLVNAGWLGRKSERGFYDYRAGASNPGPVKDQEIGQQILQRILVMLINEAFEAVFLGVAAPSDIELAMTLGVNYPKGLLRWAEDLGLHVVLDQLEALHGEYGEERYRPSPLLKRMVQSGSHFKL